MIFIYKSTLISAGNQYKSGSSGRDQKLMFEMPEKFNSNTNKSLLDVLRLYY
jgi:hypothetical protein